MKKIKLILVIFILTITLTISPVYHENSIKYSKSHFNNKNVEKLKCSTESGGGYIMNTNAHYLWIEINETGTRLDTISEGDDEEETISFLGQGWNFTFFETNYSSVQISSNGWMSFDDEGQTQLRLNKIPSQMSENIDSVALLAEDLNLDNSFYGGGDVYYNFSGTAPNRYLIVEYYQTFDFYNGELVGDFEVIFYENGSIKFQYKEVNVLDNFNPIIGLDHGDMKNYNSYDATLPLTSRAISFDFNELDDVIYRLDFNVGDYFSWKVSEVNDSAMEKIFGSGWEQKFGLLPDMNVDEKTKIEVSLINENITHWGIKYDLWDWISLNNNFGNVPNLDPTLIFRKEPLNYTEKHNLTNLIPLLLPIYSTVYLRNANLTDSYNYIGHIENTNQTEIWVAFQGSLMIDYAVGYAKYNEKGILDELYLNYTTGGKNYPAFAMERISLGSSGSSLPISRGNDDDDDTEANSIVDFLLSPVGLITIISITSGVIVIAIGMVYLKRKKAVIIKQDLGRIARSNLD